MTGTAVAWLILVSLLVLPALSVAAVWLATRRLARTRHVPRWSLWVGYGLALVGALVLVLGAVTGILRSLGAVSGSAVEPSEKARVLAEGISEVMNCGAFALLVAILGGAFVALVRWKWGRPT